MGKAAMHLYSGIRQTYIANYTILLFVAGLLFSAPAAADLNSLKAHCVTVEDVRDSGSVLPPPLSYRFCRDGVPQPGGRTPNEGALNGVAVPEKYLENGEGPEKAQVVDLGSGADKSGNIKLDLDVSLPPEKLEAPAGGYPLIVMIHGCCWGDKTSWEATTIGAKDPIFGYDDRWHYNNAWFATRGYVVLNYTSRGFRNLWGQGSTGETQLDSRQYELKDLQYLAGLLADEQSFNINPQKVVVTGGSMGGGLSWLALTEPKWKSPGGKTMQIVAVAPRDGWTDLLYSLVPTGMHNRDELAPFDGTADGTTIDSPEPIIPFGFGKLTIDSALLLQGYIYLPLPYSSSHANFAAWVPDSYNCLSQPEPIESSPACATFRNKTAHELLTDRSAYYQNDFFAKLKSGEVKPVPVFSAGTLTDPLFTQVEHQQMVKRLKSVVPDYPVQEYYGDYQHFVADKPKEWGDLCCRGTNHHLCVSDEFTTGLNNRPPNLCPDGEGVNTRLSRFIDYYANPPGDPNPGPPPLDVTAALQACPQTAAALKVRKNEAGPRYTAPSFEELAPNSLKLESPPPTGTPPETSHIVLPNFHSVSTDPVGMLARQQYCVAENSLAGPGVVTYESGPLSTAHAFTMIGRTRLAVTHTGTAPLDALQLNARLYDVFPNQNGGCGDNATAVMVDRGVRRVANPNETTIFDLDGNGWSFAANHCIRVELAQDVGPYIKPSPQSSSLSLTSVKLDVPVREPSAGRISLLYRQPIFATLGDHE